MTISTSLNPKLLRPGLKKIYGLEMAEWEAGKEHEQIFKPEQSTMRYEEYQELAGFGLVPEQTSGKNVSYDDVLNGFTTRVVNVAYGLGYKITREMIDDQMYRLAKTFPKALAKSVRLTVESLAAYILNNAFATVTYGDGQFLVDNDHPLPGGGTGSNRPSSYADLSATSFEQATIDIAGIKDSRGNTAQVKPRKLIVTPTDAYTAAKLCGSDYSPENANNAINPIVKLGLLPEGFSVNHYLTDADAWFVLTSEEGLVFQQRIWPAEFRDDNDFESLNIKQAVYFRIAFSAYNWRAIYGNSGA